MVLPSPVVWVPVPVVKRVRVVPVTFVNPFFPGPGPGDTTVTGPKGSTHEPPYGNRRGFAPDRPQYLPGSSRLLSTFQGLDYTSDPFVGPAPPAPAPGHTKTSCTCSHSPTRAPRH